MYRHNHLRALKGSSRDVGVGNRGSRPFNGIFPKCRKTQRGQSAQLPPFMGWPICIFQTYTNGEDIKGHGFPSYESAIKKVLGMAQVVICPFPQKCCKRH
jgi:hypothetical protein